MAGRMGGEDRNNIEEAFSVVVTTPDSRRLNGSDVSSSFLSME